MGGDGTREGTRNICGLGMKCCFIPLLVEDMLTTSSATSAGHPYYLPTWNFRIQTASIQVSPTLSRNLHDEISVFTLDTIEGIDIANLLYKECVKGIYACMHAYVHTLTRMYVRTYVRKYIRKYVQTCTLTHIHTYAHARTHAHTL